MKDFTRVIVRQCTSSNFAPIVEELRRPWAAHKAAPSEAPRPLLLTRWPEQLYFLYCYGYMYFTIHSLRTRHRQEIEWRPVMDLVVWLFRRPPSQRSRTRTQTSDSGEKMEVEQSLDEAEKAETKDVEMGIEEEDETESSLSELPPYSPLAEFLCESPLSLVYLLEFFKANPGTTTEGRESRILLIKSLEERLPDIMSRDYLLPSKRDSQPRARRNSKELSGRGYAMCTSPSEPAAGEESQYEVEKSEDSAFSSDEDDETIEHRLALHRKAHRALLQLLETRLRFQQRPLFRSPNF